MQTSTVELRCLESRKQRDSEIHKLAVLVAERGLKGAMVKVLIAGDVKGSVPQLLARVAQHHK